MADWRDMIHKGSIGGGCSKRSMKDEDLEEQDVWSVAEEKEDSCPSYSSGSSYAWRLPSAPRVIARADNGNPPTTATTNQAATKMVRQSSAPVNIPDWSKIYGRKNARLGSWTDDAYDDDDRDFHGIKKYHDDDDGDDYDDSGDDMVPPHVWHARKLARSQISSFSVCEGVGRTLKGRDLSKLRNAILTKTGFLE